MRGAETLTARGGGGLLELVETPCSSRLSERERVVREREGVFGGVWEGRQEGRTGVGRFIW